MMISVSEAFDKFRQKLELTKTESEDAQRRHKEVRDCIKSTFDIERDFLTGSYARYTKTKPLKDVDIFFVMSSFEKDWRGKNPNEILNAFKECLSQKYGNENIESGRRSITVNFEKSYQTQDPDGKVLSIDAVPAFDCSTCFEIPDNQIGGWIKSDPEVHKEQATAKNKELNGHWVPIVKMIKRWNRETGKPIKPSFLIEVMAQELIDPPFNTYRDEVERFFSAAQNGINEDWPDPADLGPMVSDQMNDIERQRAREALREAEKKAIRARRAEEQGKTAEALSLWREIFGSLFPNR